MQNAPRCQCLRNNYNKYNAQKEYSGFSQCEVDENKVVLEELSHCRAIRVWYTQEAY